jgi:tRNA A-37 threonylcarbamoyl transferase component Bud32
MARVAEGGGMTTEVGPRHTGIRHGRRRRRPSGAAPPLPRSIGTTGKSWLVAVGVMTVALIVVLRWRAASGAVSRTDTSILRLIAKTRTGWLTTAMRGIDRFASGWGVTTIVLSLLVTLVLLRRWRHLFTFVVAVALIEQIGGGILNEGIRRPRPLGVTIIGRWAGYSMPAAPVAVVGIIAIGITYTMVPAGRARRIAKWVSIVVTTVVALAALYLGKFHPSDIVVGLTLSVAVLVNAFRFFTPNETFPVTYKRGKTAHLDIGGRRGEALRQAVQDQLGLSVLDVKPVGLAGSGGSTPLLITVAGDPDTHLFGKLYAMSHVRADRWYKLGRTILYGRLEDEAPFQSVRRLVQFEDYALRLMRDLGIPTAAAYGIVEMTPEREYLLVTEFFDGSVEIGDAAIDDSIIDQGLLIIRHLWDAGIAHRDIKPANLLVRDGQLLLIDVAFAQIRPSPWRQAIDLANMMLVLAVRTDPERVYHRALAHFTPDEIAEAFAAARGIASPSQLRSALKSDGRDLLAHFRQLAPERRPISLQRWSLRRIVLAAAVLFAAAAVAEQAKGMFQPTHDLGVFDSPRCGTESQLILMAQAVPTADRVPCIATLPAGWTFKKARVRRGIASFTLASDIAGSRAVEATLLPTKRCSLEGVTEVPSDEVGVRRFELPRHLPPGLRSTRTYLFAGGCVTLELDFAAKAPASLIFDVDHAVGFEPRAALVARVERDTDLSLCGRGAPRCPGGSGS